MDPPKPQEAANPQLVQEYVVRIPKDKHKHLNVMRFNHSLKVDVAKWKQSQVKMERENNFKEFKMDEEVPKFGAGSEFGRDLKDEARRKKHGIITKQYNPDDQPWILKVGGKMGKKFKGIREGGVTENASYYVFTQAADGTFEAHPVEQWYNFTPIHCFKALSAEEAEEEFGRRDKVLNYFSIMVKKRLQKDAAGGGGGDDDEDEDKKPGGKKKKKKQKKEFKITDMDEWAHDLDDSDDSDNDDNNDEDGSGSKKANKKKGKKKSKKENKSDDEAVEESDEGDFDDKEVDYITSSSGSEEEIEADEKANRELKGVEDEDALRKLMSDEEEEEQEEENKETEEAPEKEKNQEQKPKQKQKKSEDTSGESSSESSDSDFDDPKFTSAIFVPNFQKSKKKTGSDNSTGSSRANTPTKLQSDKEGHRTQKRKHADAVSNDSKKIKIENSASVSSSNTSVTASPSSYMGSLEGINEETVRRYLQRKPMTASELLHKFKSKKTKMSPDQLVNKLTDVLKKIPLQKSNIKGKMYLSLKSS